MTCPRSLRGRRAQPWRRSWCVRARACARVCVCVYVRACAWACRLRWLASWTPEGTCSINCGRMGVAKMRVQAGRRRRSYALLGACTWNRAPPSLHATQAAPLGPHACPYVFHPTTATSTLHRTPSAALPHPPPPHHARSSAPPLPPSRAQPISSRPPRPAERPWHSSRRRSSSRSSRCSGSCTGRASRRRSSSGRGRGRSSRQRGRPSCIGRRSTSAALQ